MAVGQRTEYCLLTSSRRKFITVLFQVLLAYLHPEKRTIIEQERELA
jgi:hypothetical protein